MAKPLDERVKKRFLGKVEKTNGCWNWIACYHRSTGYGRFGYNGKTEGAHRVSYMIYNGRISKGMSVLHKCNNKLCVNPNHLYLGNARDNARDRNEAGSTLFGEDHQNSKLRTKDVLEIRTLGKNGMLHKYIAEFYNIGRATVTKIINRDRWKHI